MAELLAQRIITSFLLKCQPQLWVTKPVLSLRLSYMPFIKFFSQNKTILYKDVDILNHTGEISNYQDYIKYYKPTMRIIVQTLCEIFNITSANANQIIANNPLLKKRTRTNILDNYYNLIEAGVEKNNIKKNFWLLTHEDDRLKTKLECIKTLNMNNNQLVSYLHFTEKELTNYILYIQNDIDFYGHNKLEYLSDKLECSIEKLCEVTVQFPFVLKFSMPFIEKKLKILHEYNIKNDLILNDLWVLRYSEHHIRQRCELYKDTDAVCIKTWAIRCPIRVIARAIERTKTNRHILGKHKTVNEYLMNKLQVDEETLNILIAKWPAILRVNLKKLDRLITLLHENGITSDKILQHGQIFYNNIETLQNRIMILKEKGIVPKLNVLGNEKIFKRYMQKNCMERELLQGNTNVKEYLMHKLKVDKKIFDIIIARQPTILRVKIQKLSELIDLMQENDITGEDMLFHVKIFSSNTDMVRRRIAVLKKMNISLKLNLLTCHSTYFDKYVESHKMMDNLENV